MNEKYQALFENSVTALFITRPDGTILEANQAARSMFGYSEEEFRKLGRKGIIDSNSPGLSENLREREETGSTSGEVIGVRKNGERFWCEFSTSIFEDKDGGKLASMELIDMFDTKDRQESLKGVMKNVPGVIYRYVTKSERFEKTQFVSGGVKQVLGFNPDEIFEDESLGWKNIHKDDVERVIQSMNESANHNTKWVCEYRYHHPDGTTRWLRGIGNPVSKKDGRVVWDSIVIDISEEKKASLNFKLMESVATEANDAVLITSAENLEAPDGPEIVYVNRGFEKMTGYTAEEVIGKTPRILQGQDTGSKQLQTLRDAIQNRENVEVELLNYTKRGEKYWVNISLSPIFEGDKCTHFISIQKDITDRKLGEIQKSLSSKISRIFNTEKTLRKALNSSLDEIANLKFFDTVEFWLADRDRAKMNLKAYTVGNPGVAEFYGKGNGVDTFKKGEGLPGKTWEKKEGLFWRNLSEQKKFIRREDAFDAGLQSAFSFPVMDSDDVLGVLVLLLSEDPGNEPYYISLFSELADQLADEIKRKTLEEELARIYESAPDGIIVAGFDGYFKKVNPAICEMLGYSEKELLSTPFLDFVHPDDRQRTLRFYDGVNAGDEKSHFENRYVTKPGRVVWLLWTFKIFQEEKLAYAVAKDITEQKEIEELYKQAGSMAKIGSWEVNLKTGDIFLSDTTEKIFGVEPGYNLTLEEGINFYKEGPHREKVRKAVDHAIENSTSYDIEVILVTKNGEEKWIRTIGEPEFMEGECVRIYGSIQDIHDFKSTELRLENMTNNLPGVVFQYFLKPDGNDQMLYVSDEAEKIWGYSKEKASENLDLIWDRVHKEDIEAMWDSVGKAAETLGRWHHVWRYRHPDGSTRWLEGFGVPQKQPDGSTVFDAIIIDITEKKELEELLDKSNRMARIGSWEVDLVNDKIYWTDVTRDIHEAEPDYTPNLGEAIRFYKEGEHRETIRKVVEQAIENGTPWDLELQIVTAKGNERWIRAIGEAEFVNGDCKRLYGSFQDIHDRKIAEEKLKIRSRHIEAISKLNSALLNYQDWYNALSDHLEVIGEAVESDRVYYFENRYDPETGEGYTKQKLEWCKEGITSQLGNPDLNDITFSEVPELINSMLEGKPSSAILSGVDENCTTRQVMENQGIKAFLAIPVYVENRFHGFVGFDNCTSERYWSEEERTTLETITANLATAISRQHLDEQLQELLDEKNTILESIGDAFFAVDSEWTVTYWNNMARKYLGMSKEKIVGKNLWEIYDDAVELEFYSQYHKAVRDQETVHFEEYYPGTGNWFEVSAYPSEFGLSVFFKDITERKEDERRLKELNQSLAEKTKALEKSNAELEQFAFVTSHDLQEPLRMITGFLAQLERKYDDLLDEKGKKYIYFATDGAKRMRRIILDLLEFSRVGRVDTERELTNLNEIAEEAIDLNRQQVKESGGTVEVDPLPSLHVAKVPLRQLFQNLINNGLKYHEPGNKPVVQIKAEELDEFWKFSVSDNGIGISEQYKEKIFGIFQRLHRKEEYTGTGVGLAICKKIIEEHGGNIWVESEIGKGSTFYFTIPK